MASQVGGRPLPKFGEWDVNDPASAEGFTVIFGKARDEKLANGAAGNATSQRKSDNSYYKQNDTCKKPIKRWLCCG